MPDRMPNAVVTTLRLLGFACILAGSYHDLTRVMPFEHVSIFWMFACLFYIFSDLANGVRYYD